MADSAPPDPFAPPGAADTRAEAPSHASTVAELFRTHNRSLVSLLAARLHSVEEAREVAQEAYVKLLQLDQPGAVSILQAYLFRTACNLAIDRIRQRGTRTRLLNEHSNDLFDDFAERRDEIESGALASDELRLLHICLDELPEKCRRTFLLYRLEDLDQRAIGQRLGITERMVRHYISYALKYCRLRLGGATAEAARERLKR